MVSRWRFAAPLLLSLVYMQGTTASTGTSISYQEVRRTASFAGGIGATGIWPVDIDNDGIDELVLSGEISNPRASFWSIAAYDAQTGGYEIRWQSPRYLSGDAGSRISALQVVEAGATLRAWIGLENGKVDVVDLMTRESVQVLTTGNAWIQDFTIADVDNDGTLDVAALTLANTYLYDPITLGLKRTLPQGGRKIEVGNVDDDEALETVFDSGRVLEVTANSATVQWQSPTAFGPRMQLADIDADGRAEVVASAENTAVIRAWDLDTQSEQWSLSADYEVTGLRLVDVVGDATPEIVYADTTLGGIHVLEAATRNEVIQIPNPEFDFTDVVAIDADGDGGRELIWGSGYLSSSADFLNVYDVPSRTREWQSRDYFSPYEGVDAGDLDGDGTLEIVVASHRAHQGNGHEAGRILVLDADTHAVEWSVRIPDVNTSPFVPNTSLHRVKLANVDADPQLEILVATDSSNFGALYVIDGLTQEEESVVVPDPGITLAWSQITTGDLDGDGVAELITGTWALNNTSSGVFLYVLDPTDYSIVWKSPALPNRYAGPYYGQEFFAHTTDVIAADVGAPGMDIVSVSAKVHAIRWSDRHQVDSVAENYLSVVAADVSSAPGAEILAGTKAGKVDVLEGDTLAVIATHTICDGPIDALQMHSAMRIVAACDDRLVIYDVAAQSVVDVTESTVGNLGLNASMVQVVHEGRSMIVTGGDDVVTFVDVAVNHAPVVDAATASTHWRASSVDLQLTASDADGDPLVFELTSQPASGSAAWLDAAEGRLRYTTGQTARVGVDTFEVRVFDGLEYSAVKHIAVTLTNTAPTATGAQYEVTGTAAIAGTVSGVDADGDPLSYSIVQQPSEGTLTLNAATGAFEYVPSSGGSGTVAAIVSAHDGISAAQASLQFRYQAVTPPPSPPPSAPSGSSNEGKKGGGGATDVLLLAMLLGLLALARVRSR